MRLHTNVSTELHRYGHTRLRTNLAKGKGVPRMVPLLTRLEVRHLILIGRRDTLGDPPHDGNRHGVADSLVAWPIGAFLDGPALPPDQRMPVGKALEPLALERCEPSNEHRVNSRILNLEFRGNHSVIAATVKGRADVAADCRMSVQAAHGDRIAPAARCNHVRMVREQREGGIAVRTDSKGRSAPELLVTGCDLLIDGIGAARAYESGLLRSEVVVKRPAKRSIAYDTLLVADVLREPEGREDGILAGPDGGTRRGVKCREDIGFADSQTVAARVRGLADIRLQVRAAHHHGRIVLAHMRSQASGNLIADMAVSLRACHADDVLAPVRARR